MATDNSSGSARNAVPETLGLGNATRVRWFKSCRDIDANFFTRCFGPSLESRWWYATLEESGLSDQFQFEYAVVEQSAQGVAIAPAFVMNVPMELVAPSPIAAVLRAGGKLFPGIDYQRTLFVGSPCSDEGTIGLVPGVTLASILPALRAAVEKRASELSVAVVAWKDFTEEDAATLDELALACGYFKMPSYPGTMLNLPPGKFEDYLACLRHSKRYALKKKLAKSKQKLDLVAQVVRRPDKETLDQIFALFWQTYEHGKTKFERLTPEFFYRIASHDVSRFVILRAVDTGRPVAFMLCFACGRKVINKFIGLDYALGAESFLYFRLWEAAVSWVMSTGASELQSGQTGYRAKLDIGHTLVPLNNYCKHRNSIMNKIYAILSRTVSWSTLDDDLADHEKAHPQSL